jgi:HK97 family phage major capsid protein
MPDDLSAISSNVVAFGSFAGYWVRDVTPLRFDRSDDFKFDSDVVSFRVIYRTDGKVGDPNAIRLLATPAT